MSRVKESWRAVQAPRTVNCRFGEFRDYNAAGYRSGGMRQMLCVPNRLKTDRAGSSVVGSN